MHTGRTVFAQVMDVLPLQEFRGCVARYQGEYKVRGFSCLDQFLCLAFAQLTYRESLRDIETCLRGSIPEVVYISDGTRADVTSLDVLLPEPGAYYVLDRGYLDFARLARFQQVGAFFVTRAKANLQFARRYSHPVDKATGVRCDQTIVLTGPKTAHLYPLPLRRIRYTDPETGKRLVFLTDDFTLSALTHRPPVQGAVARGTLLQVDHATPADQGLLRHLRERREDPGPDCGAVYVLVAILKERLGLPQSLYTILQVLSVTLFEKVPLHQALAMTHDTTPEDEDANQLSLFNL